ncbi:FAD-dependent oxidoreductase [Croceitalea sp. MTPC5]|uniref:NAD(P)/FAD-dependent oxidoreductase n=1 Tax=Croceitalea sp. MTPC5 TaxID=3056565 RepID=UPI002B3F75F1|nr:FAD-dependent oxidoreductase [Croceitalea sp. MTPC5]
MELSYWEYKTWLSNIDYTIVGSGIVGLNTALFLRARFPQAKILILEKGVLPQGASTKNAGFACFGSISEVLMDLKTHSEEEVVELVAQRFKGIQLLRETLGDANIGFQQLGGNELFLKKHKVLFEKCEASLSRVNNMLEPIFGKTVFKVTPNTFGFQDSNPKLITHMEEAQIDTGRMMDSLLYTVRNKGIAMLNSVEVQGFEEVGNKVAVKTNRFEFKTNKLLIATNGFAPRLLHEKVKPARAQVLITRPIQNPTIKGTFHFDEGYYYFRNIDDRILFGGGRNLAFKTEETDSFGQTKRIQNELERLLRQVILPNTPFEIERRWSGIMGIGSQKKQIVKQLSNHVYCGVRLGGMGIAIGSSVGKELADLV